MSGLAEIELSLKALKETASKLNSAADAANELIRTTNERLRAIGVGVRFNATCLDGLCYGKIAGTWQLGHHDNPLLGSDREVRILAASCLPEFLKEYSEHIANLADGSSRQRKEV